MFRFELLRTQVARRILVLFVLGALAPVLILAAYSFQAVTDQLRDQSRGRLQQLSKNAGMAVLERLQGAAVDLDVAAANPALAGRLRSLSRVTVRPRSVLADSLAPGARIVQEEWDHLAEGRALLRVRPGSDGFTHVWLVRLQDPADRDSDLVWGELSADYLWRSADEYVALPTISGFCILAGIAQPIHCADAFGAEVAEGMIDGFRTSLVEAGRGIFQWSRDGESYAGSHWDLFLVPAFQAEPWTVLVSESEAVVYAPLRRFALLVPPVLVLGLIVVTLLANGLVRRTMEPLEKLTYGTRRIAAKAFETRVDVERDDEFGELAQAFNTMAERLGVQFRHLEASRAIDQAVLSASHRDEVVQALLTGFGTVVPYDRLVVVLLERDQSGGSVHCVTHGGAEVREDAVEATHEDVARLSDVGAHLVAREETDVPRLVQDYLAGIRPALILPLRVKGELRGAVAVARRDPFDADEVLRARQIVDQTAVALDEVQLVSELEEMSWGTLRALARAIDAKSRWTAGHSERVVRLAVALAREMGLPERQIDTLERGGLLHDIGKIGIPAEVLDADGPLDAEQMALMREHVLIGARILEPVSAYADAIPIVLYHHERWDGRGYPHGLARESIPLLARVLAVADTFDAMSSIRPYRSPLSRHVVVEHIGELGGNQFDPDVVAAFLRVMAKDPDVVEPALEVETAEAPARG